MIGKKSYQDVRVSTVLLLPTFVHVISAFNLREKIIGVLGAGGSCNPICFMLKRKG